MREEVVRLNYVGIPDGQAGYLRDATFSVFDGELVVLAGRPSSGVRDLMQMLVKERRDYSGSIRVGAGRKELSEFPSAYDAGVHAISAQSLQYEKVCLFDRLCLPSRAKTLWSVVDRRELERSFHYIQAEFDLTDVRFDLSSEFAGLSKADKILFELVRSVLMQCRLLVLSGIFSQCSKAECARITGVLRRLLRRGVSVVCEYDEHFPALQELVSRTVVMRHGVVGCILYPEADTGTFDIEKLNYAITGRKTHVGAAPRRPAGGEREGSALELVDREGNRILVARPGEILGIHDSLGEIPCCAEEFLAFVNERCTVRRSGKPLRLGSVSDLVRHKVAVISKVPEKELFKNLPPWENATMLSGHRISRPFHNRRVCRYLFRDTAEKYAYLEHCVQMLERKSCYGLPEERLKELVVAKWLTLDPGIVVLFALTETTFPNEQERARQLHRQLAEEGKAVVVISPNSEYLQRTCSAVAEYANRKIRTP